MFKTGNEHSESSTDILMQIILPSLFTLVLFILSGIFIFLPLVREGFISRKREMLINVTDVSLSSINNLRQKFIAGKISEDEAKQQALEEIEQFRYGSENKEYFFILDENGLMLMHPYKKDIVNTSVVTFEDPKGNRLFSKMIDTVHNSGSGFVSYYWQFHEESDNIVPKISFVRQYEPWKWIIGTGMYIEDVEEELWIIRKKVLFGILLITLITGALCAFIIRQGIRLQKKRQEAELETRENMDFLKNLINNIPSVIYIKDLAGKYLLVNKSFQALLKDDNATIQGKNDYEIFDRKTAEAFMANDTNVLKNGELLRCEEQIVQDDKINTFLSLKFPLKDPHGFITAVCGVSTDITDHIQMQKQLRDLNENLEQKVEERTKEVREANESLRASMDNLKKAQTQLVEQEKMASLGGLVAGIAHEINTPVGIGVTAASHLHEKTTFYKRRYGANELTRNDFEEFMNLSLESSEMILNNLERAAELIQSFKKIAVDQTSEDFRDFNIKDYVDELIKSLRPKLKKTKHTVEVKCSENLVVHSCPGAISQILTNLIVNSLVHGFEDKEQGLIEIKMGRCKQSICLIYSDNGKGMDEDGKKKLFEPFFTTKRGQGGSGLGMHITYNLITQKLKGTVNCESKPGEGTTFHIKIPVDAHKTPYPEDDCEFSSEGCKHDYQ